jgi:FkbM family methyltransferase
MNLRRLRGTLRHMLPESIKRRVRARLFGYTAPAVCTDWKLVPGDGHVALHANGIAARFLESVRGSLTYHCFENGDSVEELRGFLRQARSTPGTLFDVGAADGLFSTLYCLSGANHRAVAYEPSPAMHDNWRSAVGLNGLAGRMELVPAAVGSESGQVTGRLNEAGMLIVEAATSSDAVRLVCLDDELERVGPPAIVKIDVEGYEGEVLRGARRLLARHHPLLFLEFHLDLLEQRGERVEELLGMLSQLGYRFESSAGASLSARRIATSPKAIIRFVARSH